MLEGAMLSRALVAHVFGLSFAIIPHAALAVTSLSGTWEVQSLGGDRDVRIEQQGNKVIAHRVLWPEIDGQKYKLEHLYRGQISGTKIDGDLLVKEEELPNFEVLRAFTGVVTSDDKITIDGLPMKRVGKAPEASDKPAAPIPTAPNNSERPSDAPGTAQATPPPFPAPPPEGTPPLTGPAKTVTPPPAGDGGPGLFASIMGSPGMSGLFEIALKADISEEAKSLTDEADRLFGNGDFRGALGKYQAAQKAAGGPRVEFLRRIGRCHLKLNEFDEASDVLKRALRLDPANVELKKDYKLATEKSGKTKGKAKGKAKPT